LEPHLLHASLYELAASEILRWEFEWCWGIVGDEDRTICLFIKISYFCRQTHDFEAAPCSSQHYFHQSMLAKHVKY